MCRSPRPRPSPSPCPQPPRHQRRPAPRLSIDATKSAYIFNFGKKAGETLATVWATDKGYLRYMIQEKKIHTEPRMADLCAALSATGILDLYAGALDDTTALPDEERVVRAHAALVRMRTTPLAHVAKRLDDVIAMLAPRGS